MLKRVSFVALSLAVASLATVSAFIALRLPFLIGFVNRFYSTTGLLLAVLILGACIFLFRRARSFPTFVLLAGAIGLTGAALHECFIDLGLTYHWFQFGGTDGLIFRGFFEPRENPLLAVPAEIFRYVSWLIYAGIFWLAARVTQKHLTKQCGERLAGSVPHFS